MRQAVLVDCDGTLVNVSSIRHHVNPADPRFSGRKRFDLFHAESVDCPPNHEVLRMVDHYRTQGLAIIVVTARKYMWRYHTIVWLMQWGVEYDELFLRDDDDNRKDYETKEDILDRIAAAGYEPVIAIDDNPAVLALWERHGIATIRILGWED